MDGVGGSEICSGDDQYHRDSVALMELTVLLHFRN
jgi:hypothetical protein